MMGFICLYISHNRYTKTFGDIHFLKNYIEQTKMIIILYNIMIILFYFLLFIYWTTFILVLRDINIV